MVLGWVSLRARGAGVQGSCAVIRMHGDWRLVRAHSSTSRGFGMSCLQALQPSELCCRLRHGSWLGRHGHILCSSPFLLRALG